MQRRFRGLESLAIKGRSKEPDTTKSPYPSSPGPPSPASPVLDVAVDRKTYDARSYNEDDRSEGSEEESFWTSVSSFFLATPDETQPAEEVRGDPILLQQKWAQASDRVTRWARAWVLRRRTERRRAVVAAQLQWRRAKELESNAERLDDTIDGDAASVETEDAAADEDAKSSRKTAALHMHLRKSITRLEKRTNSAPPGSVMAPTTAPKTLWNTEPNIR